MPLLRALTCLLLVGGAARADPAPPAPDPSESPYFVVAAVDGPIDLIGLLSMTVPYFLLDPELRPPFCDPCDPARVNRFDRLSLSLHESWAPLGANLLLGAVGAAFVAIELADYGPRAWRGWLTDVLVIGQSVIIDGVLVEIVRRAVLRPRPFMYTAGLFPEKRDDANSSFSYYSGHTAIFVSIAVGAALTFTLRHPTSPWRWPLWFGLLALAAGEAVLRVVSGEHFPTDVLAGAAIGAGVGLAVPALHLRTSGPSLRLVTAASAEGASVSLAGAF